MRALFEAAAAEPLASQALALAAGLDWLEKGTIHWECACKIGPRFS